MKSFSVELRAWPDTPQEEEYARRQGRVLDAQTVIYPNIVAETFEKAARIAMDREMSFAYRRGVVVFDAKKIFRKINEHEG